MAISVNWATKVISVPKADMTLIQSSPTEIRELDLNTFRLTLKDLEDDIDGMPFLHTHNHNPPVTVGGVTLARVVEIINDYTVTFEDDQYAVNLVGANSNVADRANVNQVSIRAANSAGLVQVREIEFSSFNGGVAIDTVNGVVGTVYPTGTFTRPVNNIADALLIAAVRGLPTLYLLSDLTISSGTLSKLNFVGARSGITVTLGTGADLTDTRFTNMIVTGSTNSARVALMQCRVIDFGYAGENMHQCTLQGTLTLSGAGPVTLTQCIDDDPSTVIPAIDFTSFTGECALRDYFGGVELKNKSGTNSIAIDIRGRVTLASSVTGGTITVRGIGHVVDNSTGTTVLDDDLITNASVADAVWDEALSGHQVAGSAGFALDNVSGGSDPAVIADAVWDEALSGHTAGGSAGEAAGRLDAAVTTRAAPGAAMALTSGERASVAAAASVDVWDYEYPGSEIGTMTDAIQTLMGLGKHNFVLDQTSYNASGLLTAARLRIFATAAAASAATDGGTGEGELVAFTVSAEAEAGNAAQTKLFKSVRS